MKKGEIVVVLEIKVINKQIFVASSEKLNFLCYFLNIVLSSGHNIFKLLAGIKFSQNLILKCKRKMKSNFVAFLEKLNFNEET